MNAHALLGFLLATLVFSTSAESLRRSSVDLKSIAYNILNRTGVDEFGVYNFEGRRLGGDNILTEAEAKTVLSLFESPRGCKSFDDTFTVNGELFECVQADSLVVLRKKEKKHDSVFIACAKSVKVMQVVVSPVPAMAKVGAEYASSYIKQEGY